MSGRDPLPVGRRRSPGNLLVENSRFADNIAATREWVARHPAGTADLRLSDTKSDPLGQRVYRFLDSMRHKVKYGKIQSEHLREVLDLDLRVMGQPIHRRMFDPPMLEREPRAASPVLRSIAESLNAMAEHARKSFRDLRVLAYAGDYKFRFAEAAEDDLSIKYQRYGLVHCSIFRFSEVTHSGLASIDPSAPRCPAAGLSLRDVDGRVVSITEDRVWIEDPINPRRLSVTSSQPHLTELLSIRDRVSVAKVHYWSAKTGVAVFVRLQSVVRVSPVFETLDDLERFIATKWDGWYWDSLSRLPDCDDAAEISEWVSVDLPGFIEAGERYGITERSLIDQFNARPGRRRAAK